MLAAAAPLGVAQTVEISLGSTMDGNSFISEFPGTGTFAQINLGDGTLGEIGVRSTDADGLYLTDQTTGEQPTGTPFGPVGTPVDVFPREENFLVGSIAVDASAVTGVGVETVAIQSIDLGELWTADPSRTSGDPNVEQTVISDISDFGLGLWLFGFEGFLEFGDPDASDTATFTDGRLTSVDVDLDFTFFARNETFVEPGGFSISGNQFTLDLQDTIDGLTLTTDLDGTVNGVGGFNINDPDADTLDFVEVFDIAGTDGDPTPGVTLELGIGENTFTASSEDVDGADFDTVKFILPDGGEIESFLLTAYTAANGNGGTGYELFDSEGNSLGDASFPADATGTPGLALLPPGYAESSLTLQTFEGLADNEWTFTITVIPEPASALLVALGGFLVAGRPRRQARSA
ncbi:MAG: hypothetical protein AAF710_09650 [Planctomycetota bacterium]